MVSGQAAAAQREDGRCPRVLVVEDDRGLRRALRMALETAEEAMTPRPSQKGYSSDTIRFVQTQYEKLRSDEAKLRQLLGN